MIAVDLDGTLAVYGGYKGPKDIGEPIPAMMQRVRQWREEGREVIIFTARDKNSWPHIKRWLRRHGLGDMKVTNIKTYDIMEFYDDRAYRVEYNTGRVCNCIGPRKV